MKIISASLVLLVSILPLSASAAALRYDSTVEIIREDETEYLTERITVDGDNVRVDYLDEKDQPSGSYIISNDTGKTFAIHNGEKSVCAQWDRGEYFEARAAVLAKGKRLVKADVSSIETVVVSEEDGPKVEGYPTRHLKLRTTYSGQGRFLFVKLNYAVEELDELWMADSLPVPKFAEDWLQASGQTGDAFLDQHVKVWMENTHGSILKHSNVVRLTNTKSGKTEEKTEHLTISNILQVPTEELPQGVFDLPICKKVKQSELKHQAERMLKKYIR